VKLEIISKYPSVPAHPAPLLFVHGAWHGAWCWDVHFLDYFAKHGFAAHAVGLRGHGGSEGREKLRWTGLARYVEDVETVAQALPSPPVLIGHSMGGLVVQKYLERHSSPAGILLASVPPRGVLATTLRIAARHPFIFAKTNLTLSLYPIVSTPALARQAFFSKGLADEEVERYWQIIQDESYRAFLDMLAFQLPAPRKVKAPMLVLGGERDTIFQPAEVEATARAYNTEPRIFPGMAHVMMLEPQWQAVADFMLEWLAGQQLAKP
jgi:pimeloyl-ACP methyl ester carboxylesterase